MEYDGDTFQGGRSPGVGVGGTAIVGNVGPEMFRGFSVFDLSGVAHGNANLSFTFAGVPSSSPCCGIPSLPTRPADVILNSYFPSEPVPGFPGLRDPVPFYSPSTGAIGTVDISDLSVGQTISVDVSAFIAQALGRGEVQFGVRFIPSQGFDFAHGANRLVQFDGVILTVSPVPEPEVISLMLAGLALVGFIAKRRKG